MGAAIALVGVILLGEVLLRDVLDVQPHVHPIVAADALAIAMEHVVLHVATTVRVVVRVHALEIAQLVVKQDALYVVLVILVK